MPIFRCSKCGCGENTGLSNYWTQRFTAREEGNSTLITFEPLCSECDPKIGKWHGQFPKEPLSEDRLLPSGFRDDR